MLEQYKLISFIYIKRIDHAALISMMHDHSIGCQIKRMGWSCDVLCL